MTQTTSRSMPVRVGIVGTGFGAAVLLPAFSGIPGVIVTALADGGSGRAKTVVSALPGIAAMDAGTLVASPEVDLVAVAVPPAAQAKLVRQALDHGKDVLCEKPLGVDAQQASDLAAAAHRAGVATAVDFLFRYDHGFRALHNALNNGMVGRIQRVDVTWLTGGAARIDRQWSWRNGEAGGIVADFAAHVFDYLMWLTAMPVTGIAGSTATRIGSRPVPGGGVRRVMAEDECDLALRLGDSVSARVTVSNTYPAGLGHRVEVFGSEGYLELHHRPPFDADGRSLVLRRHGRTEALHIPPESDQAGDTRITAARHLIVDLLSSRQTCPSPDLPTFDDAARVAAVVAAAKRLEAIRP